MSKDSTGTYENVARTLTALEKSLDRLARSNYYNRSQYPDILLAIEEALGKVRAWLKYYRKYDRLGNFYMLPGLFIEELGAIMSRLWDICRPKAGKRKEAEDKKQQRKKTPGRDRRQTIKGRRDDDKVMPGLLRNLQGVFDKIHSDNRERDRSQEQVAEEFAVQLQQTFKEMHSQLEEREQLLDTKLKSIDRTHNYQLKRVKLMSIPITVLSLVAVVYLFYVVRVMETAMTSMSQDMHEITAYMDVMSVNTHALTENTSHISGQMSAMNRNIGSMNASVNNMRYDVHNMSRSVSPAMSSISRFMP